MKTNCRIHLSSAPVFVREDSDVCPNDVEPPHIRSTDYTDLQKLSLDLCSLGFLDSCLSLSPLNALLHPSQADITTPGSPVSFFPVVSDMLLIPVSEHNDQNVHLLQEQKPEWLLDGREVHHSSTSVTRISPKSWGPPNLLETQPLTTHKEILGMPCPPVPDGIDPNKLVNVLSEVELKHHQQSQVCGLHEKPAEVPLHNYEHGAMVPLQECSNPHFSWKDLSAPPPSLTEVREFAHSSQVVLRGLQEGLDSEATVTSSSEEEPEDLHSLLWEMQQLEERAELSSRWSWLQLRLAELKGRIQQMDELQKHLRSTKAKVVLAESQPLTIRRVQHTLMRDRTGFSCTASDSDAEPCSPTRLLCSIERQSAQLSQIVKSLLPPLNCSPLSKQPSTLTGSSAFQRSRSCSGQRGGDVFHSASFRRSRLVTRRPVKVVMSCARTRPAVALHKRKLFIFNCGKDFSLQDSVDSICGLSSSVSSCSHVSSGEHGASDVSCRSSSGFSSSSFCSGAPSSSSDSSACQQSQRLTLREEWSQRPLVINAEVFSPLGCRRSSTPMTRHKYRSHLRNPRNQTLDLSPIRSSCYPLGPTNKPWRRRRRRKRRTCICGPVEDMDVLHHHCYHGDESSNIPEESYAQVSNSKASQTFLQKDIVYHINDVIIHSSSHRLEKLQYKEIPTPRWRVVQMEPLTGVEMEKDEDNEKLQVENLTDDVFAQRHLLLEQKEKSRWCCRRPARSASRMSGSGSGKCTSGEESCGQPDQLLRLEERATPWEPRLFPLTEAECADLLAEEDYPPGRTDSTSSSHLSNAAAPISPCSQRVQHCPLVDK
ncbi:KAT8 regulatory NSL complex subunit 1-like protein isoform X3 [Oryzias melastigma]|nr:KAT8 regulatory NSL complex subunit 1-like protein isoform X3 [Oryzias melastigma]